VKIKGQVGRESVELIEARSKLIAVSYYTLNKVKFFYYFTVKFNQKSKSKLERGLQCFHGSPYSLLESSLHLTMWKWSKLVMFRRNLLRTLSRKELVAFKIISDFLWERSVFTPLCKMWTLMWTLRGDFFFCSINCIKHWVCMATHCILKQQRKFEIIYCNLGLYMHNSCCLLIDHDITM
jgi:hypothetical protein